MSQPQQEFVNLVTQIMERLGIQAFDTQATSYRFSFANEPAIFLCYRGDGWAELVTSADRLTNDPRQKTALALLELQGQQPNPGFCLAADKESGVTWVFHRFRFSYYRALDVIDTLKAMRTFASQVRAVIGQTVPPAGTAASDGNERLKLSAHMKLQNLYW